MLTPPTPFSVDTGPLLLPLFSICWYRSEKRHGKLGYRFKQRKINMVKSVVFCTRSHHFWPWHLANLQKKRKDMVVLPYKDSLLLFSRYMHQLVMESLGKEFDLYGNRLQLPRCSVQRLSPLPLLTPSTDRRPPFHHHSTASARTHQSALVTTVKAVELAVCDWIHVDVMEQYHNWTSCS